MIELEGMRYAAAYRRIRHAFEQADISCFDADARYIMEGLGLPLEKMLLFDGVLDAQQGRTLAAWAHRRLSGEPVQYILGKAYFMGMELTVRPGVLIPRLDTEILAQCAAQCCPDEGIILDLCCGSGCVGIFLARSVGAAVLCADVDEGCLALTRQNARENGVETKIRTQCSDLFDGLEGRRFQMIVCNPPYISGTEMGELQREVKDFEPHRALYGGVDGLDFYRRIAKQARHHLTQGGVLLLEVGHNQAAAVSSMLEGYQTGIVQDLNGMERVVCARLE
ncbi:MAG: peptide chain release factor N(5)-glutamine methyltransferase [Christensenellales bacterium]|jgi:release factor glutamine methyltransferase